MRGFKQTNRHDNWQNCLRQKDDALNEYRVMMEEMRQQYSSQCLQCSEQLTVDEPPQADPGTLDSIYNELFVKPSVQQNEELLMLLRKAFHELKL